MARDGCVIVFGYARLQGQMKLAGEFVGRCATDPGSIHLHRMAFGRGQREIVSLEEDSEVNSVRSLDTWLLEQLRAVVVASARRAVCTLNASEHTIRKRNWTEVTGIRRRNGCLEPGIQRRVGAVSRLIGAAVHPDLLVTTQSVSR